MNGRMNSHGEVAANLPALWSEVVERMQSRTPARILKGRVGSGYRTQTHLELRRDHAAAQDAVRAECSMEKDLPSDLVRECGLFEVQTQASTKAEYLLRPDLGRRLSLVAERDISARCDFQPELQIFIGDGLSAAAIRVQIPQLLPGLIRQAKAGVWRVGRPFFVRYCRVGVLNDVGRVLAPDVAILLIGERPGLATAESLSAYLAWRPVEGHTDANRNLISNIHARGLSPTDAVGRILALAESLRAGRQSGTPISGEGETSKIGRELGP